MIRKHIIPFVIVDLDYKIVPDQSDEHTSSACEIECIVNLDDILDKSTEPQVQKRYFDRHIIVRPGSKEGDIGCLHIEYLTDGEYNDNPSVSLQVFYGKEIYDMFLPIILSAYHGTDFYSLLMQRHRDEQIGRLFSD